MTLQDVLNIMQKKRIMPQGINEQALNLVQRDDSRYNVAQPSQPRPFFQGAPMDTMQYKQPDTRMAQALRLSWNDPNKIDAMTQAFLPLVMGMTGDVRNMGGIKIGKGSGNSILNPNAVEGNIGRPLSESESIVKEARNLVKSMPEGFNQPSIPKSLQSLAQEARKYKSAEEFVSKINKEVPITKDRFGRTSLIRTQDTLPPLEAGHIRLYRAEGGKRNFDTALRKTNISELPKGFVEGDTNFYTPSLADADFYAKEYGAKIKYIDVPESLAQKINPSEYLVSKSQLTDFYTQATKGVGGIRGGK